MEWGLGLSLVSGGSGVGLQKRTIGNLRRSPMATVCFNFHANEWWISRSVGELRSHWLFHLLDEVIVAAGLA